MDFYAELSDLYPDSVVLLSARDSDEQWWRSWVDTLGVYYCNNWRGLFLRALIWPIWSLADSVWMTPSFVSGWRERYDGEGPLVHRRHNVEVMRRISSERLLVFNVKEGWDPICTFLGLDVPNEPFPRLYVLRCPADRSKANSTSRNESATAKRS